MSIAKRPRRKASISTTCSRPCRPYLGSVYVNDFNRFGRTYQVNVSAEPGFRREAKDIPQLKTRNAAGEMVPLGSFVTVSQGAGPDRVSHYNGYATAEINGTGVDGVSSGQAQALMEELAATNLPRGMSYEWTELTYQKIISGDTTTLVFSLCVLLAFLVLAAQYESWSLPLVGNPDRADEPVLGDQRRLADWRRQQHLHADRLDRAGRPRLQERDSDRRVRPRTATGRHGRGHCGEGSGPACVCGRS